MAKYQRYAEYKDSGVEWLGEIPSHWKITALKRYCAVKGGYAFSSDIFSSVGAPVIRIGDIKTDGSISLESCKFIPTELAKSSQAYLVEKGQLLMAMTGATIGKAGVYVNDSPAYLNQRVGKFVIDNNELNYNFLWYTLKTNGYQEYIKLTAFGGAQPNISDTGMVDYISCFPSIIEQTQIANFLDHETAKIDSLIEKQQQLIQLLKEKRQAVISHAVTKGLNPDVPMKDSGVEWLGQVPEHWTVSKLKHFVNVVDCKHITAEFFDEGIPLASIGEVKGWKVNLSKAKLTNEKYYFELIDGNRKPQIGDIIYTRNATVGEAALVHEELSRFALGQDVCLIHIIQKLYPEFLLHFLKSEIIKIQLNSAMVGSTFKRINVDDIRNYVVIIPPFEEQKEILKALETNTKQYDSLIFSAEKQIDLMQERRTALISSAVTGKIDVRHWQNPNKNNNKSTEIRV